MNKENLKNYDALIIYANYDSISNPQADALLSFVKSGKGFITDFLRNFDFAILTLANFYFQVYWVHPFLVFLISPVMDWLHTRHHHLAPPF